MTDGRRPSEPAFETDHLAERGYDAVRVSGLAGSLLLHLTVAAVALPLAMEPSPRLSASAWALTIDLSLPPPELAGTLALSPPAARAVPGATAEGPEAAPQLRAHAAPIVVTPAPPEPHVAIVLPSPEPPPTLARHDFAAGAGTAASSATDAPTHQAEGSAFTGQGVSRIAPPSSGGAPVLAERTTVEAAQGLVREDRPRRAVQQNRTKGTEPASLAASVRPARAAAFETRMNQARQDYLARLVAQLSRQRFDSSSGAGDRGLVVARLDIARDGRLLDVGLVRSSGHPAFDRSVATAIRRAAPFAPLPPELDADRFSFVVPLGYSAERAP